VALLRRHVDPPDALDPFLPVAAPSGALLAIELPCREAEEFLRLVDETANHAQSIEDGERLGRTFQRLEDGLADAADPGAHLLRPAASAVGCSLKQGQYLAFIYWYSQVHRRAPAEADFEAYFRVSPPSVHAMLKTLERRGFIKRGAGIARSIQLQLRPDQIPALDDGVRVDGAV